jgi:hypothetical protein
MRAIGFASHVRSNEFRMLVVCLIQQEKSIEVKAGRRDIYTRVPVISCINMLYWLTNSPTAQL